MIETSKFALVLLLFLLFFIGLRHFLLAAVNRQTARLRLHYVQQAAIGNRMSRFVTRYGRIHRHLCELLESTRYRMSIGGFLTLTLVLFLLGFVEGGFFFGSAKGAVSLSLSLSLVPYLVLRLKLISLHLKTRLDFLPAVEVFYQVYVLSAHKNFRSVLKECLRENRIQSPIRQIFEQLYRNLCTNRDTEDCLRLFKIALGHLWADYFASIILIAVQEGNDISANVKELIADMRKAQLADQAVRYRLLEIRIASFSPVFFLAAFLIVNFKINYANAYHYYVMDPDGRNMLLDALLLIFGSFIMGVLLSLKRM
jgi:hypothetical protein